MLKDFALQQGRISASPVHQGTFRFKDPGASTVISADSSKDGVVWVVPTKRWNEHIREAILQTYDAADASHQLLSLPCGSALRFTTPLIAEGRMHVGTRGGILVFGLLKPPGR